LAFGFLDLIEFSNFLIKILPHNAAAGLASGEKKVKLAENQQDLNADIGLLITHPRYLAAPSKLS
jgi:hypothetical protein